MLKKGKQSECGADLVWLGFGYNVSRVGRRNRFRLNMDFLLGYFEYGVAKSCEPFITLT